MSENRFETLSENRTEFLKRLALDDELAKIMINGNKSYKENTVNLAQKIGLAYTQIFPYQKIMEKITETKSFITMKFKYKKAYDLNFFKASQITFFCFCHSSLIATDYKLLRYDAMLSAVDRLINDTENPTWIGTMKFDEMSDIIMDSSGNYIGIAVTYKNVEFQ